MILRLTSEKLRKLADQLDALSAFEAAGATHIPSGTVMEVDGVALAYTYWWDDKQQHMAEFIDFTPGDSRPLVYHDVSTSAVLEDSEEG